MTGLHQRLAQVLLTGVLAVAGGLAPVALAQVPELSLSTATTEITEGGTITITVSRTSASPDAAFNGSLQLSLEGGGRFGALTEEGVSTLADTTPSTGPFTVGSFSLPAGGTGSATFDIATDNDRLDEPDARDNDDACIPPEDWDYSLEYEIPPGAHCEGNFSFRVTLAAGTGYTVGSPDFVDIIIRDNDKAAEPPVINSVTATTDTLTVQWSGPTETGYSNGTDGSHTDNRILSYTLDWGDHTDLGLLPPEDPLFLAFADQHTQVLCGTQTDIRSTANRFTIRQWPYPEGAEVQAGCNRYQPSLPLQPGHRYGLRIATETDAGTSWSTPLVFATTCSAAGEAPPEPQVRNQAGTEAEAFRYQFRKALSPGCGETYSATLANGDPLPGWLRFDAAKRTFSGTPAHADTPVDIDVKVTVRAGGQSSEQTFNIDVPDTDSPPGKPAVADRFARPDIAFTYVVPEVADPEGETVTYAAAQSDGTALPSWLTFNAMTRTFSGTPAASLDGTETTIRVTATAPSIDGSETKSSTADFTLSVRSCTVPCVVGVEFSGSPSSNMTYGPGERVMVQVDFNTYVRVEAAPAGSRLTCPPSTDDRGRPLGNLPCMALKVGDSTKLTTGYWEYDGSAGSQLYFWYHVAGGDLDEDGVSVAADRIFVDGATITSSTQPYVDADLSHGALGADPNRKVDGGARASIYSIGLSSTPANGGDTYLAGETITVAITFRSNVVVVGTPELTLDVGGKNRMATCGQPTHSGQDSTISCSYTVAGGPEGDLDADGISIPASSLILGTDSGTAESITARDGGAPADLGFQAVQANARHRVNGRPGTALPPVDGGDENGGGNNIGGGNNNGGSGGGGGGGSTPRNNPPEAGQAIGDQATQAGAALEIELSDAFDDPDGDDLGHAAESSDEAVASVEVDGDTLRVRGVGEGTAQIKVTATDPDGRSASQTFTVTVTGPEAVWYLPPASDAVRQGFVRVINHSNAAGEATVTATDDAGHEREPLTLALGPRQVVGFNTDDLELGNAAKGLAGSASAGEGGWRLAIDGGGLDVEALAYIRTPDGFVTAMNAAAPADGDGALEVATFNPGSNHNQVSLLRLVNPTGDDAKATVTGVDDAGRSPGAPVRLSLPAGTACTVDAGQLESGSGLACGEPQEGLGDGVGKWRLAVASAAPLVAMSLMESPTGHLTNLSGVGSADAEGVRRVSLFPPASDPNGQQGFVRVANRSNRRGAVTIRAFDDGAFDYEPLELALDAGQTAHFNSDDLEVGNRGKGLTGSTGPGVGTWRLELSSEAIEFEANAYVRHADGFLTAMNALAPAADGVHRVAFLNPGSNHRRVGVLRLINPGRADAAVSVTGTDDAGLRPGAAVRLTVPGGSAVELPSQALESGEAEDPALIESGALGDGSGKWRLRVDADREIAVMSLLSSASGHLTNLSGADGGRGLGPEPAALLPPPRNVSLERLGHRRLRGRWDAAPGVRHRVALLRDGAPVEGRSLAATARTDFGWSGLEPGTYRVRVCALNEADVCGPSGESNAVVIR